MSNKYTIGVDGGGTKTLGVLWDNNNNEIKRVTKGFANFNVDLEKSKQNIKDVINDLIKEAKDNPNIVIGVSGYTGLINPEDFEKELSELFKANVLLKDDGFLALNSVDNTNHLPVVLVISGTGSIVYALKNNKHFRFGGHGHLLGDEGSSYDVAARALRKLINEFDLGNELSEFSKLFVEKTNINSAVDIKQLVYHNTKNEVAKYSRIVDELSYNNDEAKDIIVNSAKDFSKQIISLTNKLEISDNYILALRGGMLENSKTFRKTLLDELSNNNQIFIVDDSNNEPVFGALQVMQGEKK